MDDSVVTERKKPSPFDFVKSIIYTKINLMIDYDKGYAPYVVNMNLSTDKGCMIMANEMNCRPHIPDIGQYLFLMNAIPKKKRYLKYPKSATKIEDLVVIEKYYQCNYNKCLEILSILTEQQLSILKEKMDVGGKR